MVHWWVLVHYGPLRGILDKTHQTRLWRVGIVMIHFIKSIKGIFILVYKINATLQAEAGGTQLMNTHFWAGYPET
jgi:uncharacterized membrane protein